MTTQRPASRFHPRPSAPHLRQSAFCLVFAAFSLAAEAQVAVKDAWVRATVPAQKSTGAFMTLTSREDAKLVSASSPVAKIVEVHSSMMSGGVAHMHAVDAVDLPAGKDVKLQPGGFHVMLIGLAAPVTAGQQVPLTLTIQDKRGARSTLEVKAEARPMGR